MPAKFNILKDPFVLSSPTPMRFSVLVCLCTLASIVRDLTTTFGFGRARGIDPSKRTTADQGGTGRIQRFPGTLCLADLGFELDSEGLKSSGFGVSDLFGVHPLY
jgi:hypothetical protein